MKNMIHGNKNVNMLILIMNVDIMIVVREDIMIIITFVDDFMVLLFNF